MLNSGNTSAGATILNSRWRHSLSEVGKETRSVNVGLKHDPPLEGLRAAHGQGNKYGVPESKKSSRRLHCYQFNFGSAYPPLCRNLVAIF